MGLKWDDLLMEEREDVQKVRPLSLLVIFFRAADSLRVRPPDTVS